LSIRNVILKGFASIFVCAEPFATSSAGLQDVACFVVCRPFYERLSLKEEHIEVEGTVATVLAGTMFRVQLENKHMVLATICGKMRKRWVRLTAGDRVKMEMSPYDLNKARITWRLK
jgi:translation initiation factor IF-1